MKKQFGLDILAKRKRRPEKDIRVIGEYGVENNGGGKIGIPRCRLRDEAKEAVRDGERECRNSGRFQRT